MEGSGAANGGGHDALPALGLLESDRVRKASMLGSGRQQCINNTL
jgi:hypothetical protein